VCTQSLPEVLVGSLIAAARPPDEPEARTRTQIPSPDVCKDTRVCTEVD
jgi:hypothetical protein